MASPWHTEPAERARGADWKRRSHTAAVASEDPVTHRWGREGCTSRQVILLAVPCTHILVQSPQLRTTDEASKTTQGEGLLQKWRSHWSPTLRASSFWCPVCPHARSDLPAALRPPSRTSQTSTPPSEAPRGVQDLTVFKQHGGIQCSPMMHGTIVHP